MRQPGSYPLVIMVVATLALLATHVVCLPRLKGRGHATPSSVERALNDLIQRTKVAKAQASKVAESDHQNKKNCKGAYSNALYNLERSVGFYKARDMLSFKIYVSAAIDDYSGCDDGYADSGKRSPFGSINEALSHSAGSILEMC